MHRLLFMLALISGMLAAVGCALAEDLPSLDSAIERSAFLSIAEELCERPLAIDFSSLNARVRAAVTRCQISPDSEDPAACAILRGLELLTDRSWEAAFAALAQASADYEHSRDAWGVWIAQWLMGSALFVRGDPYGSEPHLHKALEQIDAITSREANAARSSNLLVEILGMPEEISQLIEQHPTSTLPKLIRLARTMTHYHLGLILACQKRYATAETYLRASLEILQRAPGGTFDLGPLLETLGLVELMRGEFDTAVEVLRQAQEEAFSTAGFLSLQRASSLSRRLSGLYSSAGRLEEGLEINRKALDSGPATPSRQALLWLERGELHARGGRLLDTQRAMTSALAVIATDETPWLEEQMLFIIGMRLSELGLFEEAARYLQQAVSQLESQTLAASEQRLLEGALLFLNVAYGQLGLDALQQDSIANLEKEVAESGHDQLLEISEALVAMQPPADAQTAEERHLPFAEAFQQLRTRLRESGSFWEDFGKQLEPAFESLKELQAVEGEDFPEHFREHAGEHGLERVMALLLPAVEHLEQGRIEEALSEIETFHEAFITREQLHPLHRASMSMGLAELQAFFPEHLSEGLATAKIAIDTFESFVAQMRTDDAVASLIDDRGHLLYRRAVDLFARVDTEAAFVYAERGRAWPLRRFSSGASRQVTDDADGLLEGILKELSLLEQHIQIRGESQTTRAKLRDLRREYEVERLRSRLAADGEPMPVVQPDLERLRAQLASSDQALVAYFPGRDRWWIWVIDLDGIDMTSIPIPDENLLDNLIRAVRSSHKHWRQSHFSGPRGGRRLPGLADENHADISSTLYQQLIAPIADKLCCSQLIIVPHGFLHHLPFAALRNPENGRYFIEDFILSLAPSATFLTTLESRQAKMGSGENTLILADTLTHLEVLPGARREAETVAEILGSSAPKLLLGKEATESRLYAAAGHLSLLHLATHGEYLAESPYFSRLLLTADAMNDGRLEMHEVWDRLDLGGTDLVVLSGCQTALGEVSRGDEIVGLSRAFLMAGSRTIIATLWRVDDPASARLMTSFYDHFARRGETVAGAMRAAQLAMLRDARLAAPYYWAAFQVTGDPDTRIRLPIPKTEKSESR